MSVSLPAVERVRMTFEHADPPDHVAFYGELRCIPFIEHMSGKKMAGSQFDMEVVTAMAYRAAGITCLRRLLTPRWDIETNASGLQIQWDAYLNWKVGGDKLLTYEEAVAYLDEHANRPMNPHDEAAATIRETNRLQKILGEEILFIPCVPASVLESLYHHVGFDNFALIMYDRPELIDAALERDTVDCIQRVEVIHDLYDGPVLHCCDDLGMKDKTLFSPRWMRKHVFPRMRRVADAIHAGNKWFSFHSCGNVTSVVGDLIDAGIDALNPLEYTSGMRLTDVKRDHGDKIVLCGNFDTNLAQMGTPEQYRAEVRRLLDEGAPGGGFMLSIGCTQATPMENLIAGTEEALTYQGWRTA